MAAVKKITTGDGVVQLFADGHPTCPDVGAFYDKMSGAAYDDMTAKVKFIDPYRIAEVVAKAGKDDDEQGGSVFGLLNAKRDSRIFDVGQGTGILGKILTAEGFTNISGGDASPEFLKVANASGWYAGGCKEMWFGKGANELPSEMIGAYDVVMGAGVFLDGHFPSLAFEECHALLRTGGHFVFALRDHYWVDGEECGYKEAVEGLLAQGKFKLVKDWTFPRGIPNAKEPMFAEMNSYMMCLQRAD